MGTGKLLGRPDVCSGATQEGIASLEGGRGGGWVGSSDTPSLFMQRHNLQLD